MGKRLFIPILIMSCLSCMKSRNRILEVVKPDYRYTVNFSEFNLDKSDLVSWSFDTLSVTDESLIIDSLEINNEELKKLMKNSSFSDLLVDMKAYSPFREELLELAELRYEILFNIDSSFAVNKVKVFDKSNKLVLYKSKVFDSNGIKGRMYFNVDKDNDQEPIFIYFTSMTTY